MGFCEQSCKADGVYGVFAMNIHPRFAAVLAAQQIKQAEECARLNKLRRLQLSMQDCERIAETIIRREHADNHNAKAVVQGRYQGESDKAKGRALLAIVPVGASGKD